MGGVIRIVEPFSLFVHDKVAEFVRHREPLAYQRVVCIDADDRALAVADDHRGERVGQRPGKDTDAQVACDPVDVDRRPRLPGLLKDFVGRRLRAVAVDLDRGGRQRPILRRWKPARCRAAPPGTRSTERLDAAIEALALLCEPVDPPRGELEHIHYFCGNTEIPANLAEREPQRAALYKATVALVRAYANIADELEPAGYSAAEIGRVKVQLDHYLNVREVIRKASGESLDLKAYEADMRHLIDTYIEADEPRTISPFENMSLLELITKTGIAAAIATQLGGMKGNQDAIAETIENNVRRKIIKEHLGDPAYYAKMSTLLDEIITTRKAKAIEYEEYLRRIAEVARRVEAGLADDTPEPLRHSPALRALYNNLKVGGDMVARATRAAEAVGEYAAAGDPVLELALRLDSAVRRVRPDAWRGVRAKEQVIKAALYGVLQDHAEVERLFLIVRAQGEY
jgi:type I restriction enzyme, R subunit